MQQGRNKILYYFIFIATALAWLIPAAKTAFGYSEYEITNVAVDTAPPPAKESCPHPDRRPHKSDHKGKHIDEDCCPDPDEWPNPKCAYPKNNYGIMLSRP